MRNRRFIVALVIPMALVSACGSDDGSSATDSETSSSASDTPSESASDAPPPEPTESEDPTADWPACDSVWSDGADLPGGYRGCREGLDAVKSQSRSCSFGRPLVTYADRFYAVPTGVIHETDGPLKQDRGYRSALASCTA